MAILQKKSVYPMATCGLSGLISVPKPYMKRKYSYETY